MGMGEGKGGRGKGELGEGRALVVGPLGHCPGRAPAPGPASGTRGRRATRAVTERPHNQCTTLAQLTLPPSPLPLPHSHIPHLSIPSLPHTSHSPTSPPFSITRSVEHDKRL